MPKAPSQDALARRALIEDIKADRRGWLQHGAAALAVTVLGLGVAGSVALTSSAQHTSAAAARTSVITTSDLPTPAAFARETGTTSRSTGRAALDPARVKSLADQRAEQLAKTDDAIEEAASDRAASARAKTLESTTESTQTKAAELARRSATARATAGSGSAEASAADEGAAAPSGKSCLPVRGGYRIAAKFGQVGIWARYHTGFDFSAPIGTTLQAADDGVVTNAGTGRASGWAGHYVTIRHSDGTQSLYAHMSTVAVRVGQQVSACDVVGAVGMTGRTFGPHVHFEVYPAGVEPGDIYKAVDPAPWMHARGLKP